MEAASPDSSDLQPALPPAIALRFLDALGLCLDQPAGRAERRAARLSDALQAGRGGQTAHELIAALADLKARVEAELPTLPLRKRLLSPPWHLDLPYWVDAEDSKMRTSVRSM